MLIRTSSGKGLLGALAFLLSVALAHQPVHDPNRLIQPDGVTAQPFQLHHRIPLARVLSRLAQRLQVAGSNRCHNSKAVHRAYAKRALVKIPSLEEYEQKAAAKVEAVT